MTNVHDDDSHRLLREQLGAYALGQLVGDERQTLGAHLDGCPACRAELGEIAPAAAALDRADLSRVQGLISPPPGLGEAIMASIAAERTARAAVPAPPAQPAQSAQPAQPVQAAAPGPTAVPDLHPPVRLDARSSRTATGSHRRTPARAPWLAAAAAVVVALGGGLAVGRATAPEVPKPPLEAIELRPADGSGVAVSNAALVAHTWGVEVRFVGTGFVDGEVYEAEVRQADGTWASAGEFVGNGGTQITCQMQSGLLRDQAAAFVVTDDTGEVVLRADL